MQVLLAEKDAELRQLAQRIERMEARRGAIDELQQLDALEARLKVCPDLSGHVCSLEPHCTLNLSLVLCAEL